MLRCYIHTTSDVYMLNPAAHILSAILPFPQYMIGAGFLLRILLVYVLEAPFYLTISIQGNSGPMVLHKCLALATCIRSKSN